MSFGELTGRYLTIADLTAFPPSLVEAIVDLGERPLHNVRFAGYQTQQVAVETYTLFSAASTWQINRRRIGKGLTSLDELREESPGFGMAVFSLPGSVQLHRAIYNARPHFKPGDQVRTISMLYRFGQVQKWNDIRELMLQIL